MKRTLLVLAVVVMVLGLFGAGFVFRQITKRTVGEFFDSNGIRIHYTVEGEGEPVILVHGVAANADVNWRAPGITEALARHYKVIALDNRGHGLSDKPHEKEKYGTQFCEDIVRLMDHLGIEKARVVGYSMGCFVTLKLVTMHPDRLVCAAACGAGWADPGEEPGLREMIAKSLESGNGFGPLMTAISPPGEAPRGRRVRYLNFMLSLTNDTTALAAVFRSLGDLAITEEQLRANTVPVLSVVGTKDPLRRGVDRMTGVMANHKAVYIEGGNHLSTLSDPKFLQAIREFLENPAEYVGTKESHPESDEKEAA